MAIQHVILLFMGMLLLAIIIEPLAEKARLPFIAALLLVGFAVSEILVALSIDTGIRWNNFHGLIFFVFLPILIFEAAFNLNLRLLVKNIIPVLFLALPLMLLSTALIGTLLYYGIGHPAGFPWVAALLTGALLSATDPAAVLALFKKAGVPERLYILVDGESLFNDATAIVLFTLLISIAIHGDGAMDIPDAAYGFLKTFFGGIFVGGLLGGSILLLLPLIESTITRSVVSLIAAYISFVLAEGLLHVSGVMSVLTVGLLLGHASRNAGQKQQHGFMHELWEYKAYVANAMLFLISGITIQVAMFTDQWLAILMGIAASMIARLISIMGVMPLLNYLPGMTPIDIKYRTVMYWGNIRGAVTLALALSLPIELPYWWTIQSIAYGVVIFTIFIQATTMPLLLDALKPGEEH